MVNLKDWHIYADRFLEYDISALLQIPASVSTEEIRTYLLNFHGMSLSLVEITAFREQKPESQVYPMK